MRDEETVETALSSAETGHLVFSTLHTLNATETINRIIDFFPLEQNKQIRAMLAGTLQGIISQRLVRTVDGKGRVPIVEVMVATSRIKDMIDDPDADRERSMKRLQKAPTTACRPSTRRCFTHLKAGNIIDGRGDEGRDQPERLQAVCRRRWIRRFDGQGHGGRKGRPRRPEGRRRRGSRPAEAERAAAQQQPRAHGQPQDEPPAIAQLDPEELARRMAAAGRSPSHPVVAHSRRRRTASAKGWTRPAR